MGALDGRDAAEREILGPGDQWETKCGGNNDNLFWLLAAETGGHGVEHAAGRRDNHRDGRTRSAEVDQLGDREEAEVAVHRAEHEGREEEVHGEADEEALDLELAGRVGHMARVRAEQRRLVALEGRHGSWVEGYERSASDRNSTREEPKANRNAFALGRARPRALLSVLFVGFIARARERLAGATSRKPPWCVNTRASARMHASQAWHTAISSSTQALSIVKS
eukprot:scaffold28387_cov58-Phaeocystis_antarctica.AAC.2